MDQMLLTGLVSCRFSSLADGSTPGVSVTAPRLKFSLVSNGELSDKLTSEAKVSPIAGIPAPMSVGSVAQITGTTEKIPAVKTMRPKTM